MEARDAKLVEQVLYLKKQKNAVIFALHWRKRRYLKWIGDEVEG